MQADLGGLEHRKREARKRITRLQDSLAHLHATASQLETQLANQKTVVECAIYSASEVCPRMATIRPHCAILSEISKLEECLNRELPLDSAERERIEEQYLQAMKRYEDVENNIKESRRALEVWLH